MTTRVATSRVWPLFGLLGAGLVLSAPTSSHAAPVAANGGVAARSVALFVSDLRDAGGLPAPQNGVDPLNVRLSRGLRAYLQRASAGRYSVTGDGKIKDKNALRFAIEGDLSRVNTGPQAGTYLCVLRVFREATHKNTARRLIGQWAAVGDSLRYLTGNLREDRRVNASGIVGELGTRIVKTVSASPRSDEAAQFQSWLSRASIEGHLQVKTLPEAANAAAQRAELRLFTIALAEVAPPMAPETPAAPQTPTAETPAETPATGTPTTTEPPKTTELPTTEPKTTEPPTTEPPTTEPPKTTTPPDTPDEPDEPVVVPEADEPDGVLGLGRGVAPVLIVGSGDLPVPAMAAGELKAGSRYRVQITSQDAGSVYLIGLNAQKRWQALVVPALGEEIIVAPKAPVTLPGSGVLQAETVSAPQLREMIVLLRRTPKNGNVGIVKPPLMTDARLMDADVIRLLTLAAKDAPGTWLAQRISVRIVPVPSRAASVR